MRRSLVLTTESARHPFRASLPTMVRRPVKAAARAVKRPAQVRTASATTSRRRKIAVMTRDDVRGFVNSYLVCLVAAVAFVA